MTNDEGNLKRPTIIRVIRGSLVLTMPFEFNHDYTDNTDDTMDS